MAMPQIAVRRHDCHGCPLHALCIDEAPAGAALPVQRQPCLAQRSLRLSAGEHLFRVADDTARQLYVIRAGDIKLYQHGRDGGQHIVEFLGPGAWLGLESLFQPQHTAAAVALSACEVVVVPYPWLTALLDRQPRSAEAFAQMLSATVARHQRHAAMLRHTTALQRIAQFLLQRLELAGAAQGDATPAAPRASLPMSRQDIADYLALTASTVSRWLSVLRRRGWLVSGQRGVTLPAPAMLRRLAAGEVPAEPD
ncbi:Crp/Fnr family transcriptional regulator [Duganella callida]|uniref:Crp/Fnr family transcriptional regulator n=1 Tax=Duganella callida TaxID=2561932 RepID=A0A4Y9SGP4_9BURK|nr:Crp/Fnr family transcriptional regulator [Duganella callida]TFW19381.1 Crp/Fnr family transcriptional regulator [Duganella callida]